jgi:hypothetical protein
LQERKLAPLDRAMRGDYAVDYRGRSLRIPVAQIDRLLAGTGDSATFGTIREMLVNDVYLRAFKALNAPTVVDLGSNRGFFLLIAARVLCARVAVGVEPLEKYDKPFELLCAWNNINCAAVHRHGTIVSADGGAGRTTMDSLIHEHDLRTIDFLKCDIEGAEFELFTRNNAWLGRCTNIAMELHPAAGDPRMIVNALRQYGFACVPTDQFGASTAAENAHYLYASSAGHLL